jgi:hypothetical protein
VVADGLVAEKQPGGDRRLLTPCVTSVSTSRSRAVRAGKTSGVADGGGAAKYTAIRAASAAPKMASPVRVEVHAVEQDVFHRER